MEERVIKKTERLSSGREISRFMETYYRDLDRVARTKEAKIAWCTSVGPAELLRALGFYVYFPETHAAMIGAVKQAAQMIPRANALGFSPEICSYLTSDIGAHLMESSPLSKVYPGIQAPPPPDVLVFNTNQCRDVQDWFAWYSRIFKVPILGINSYVGVSEVSDGHVPSILSQLEKLIPPLEKIAGKKMDRALLEKRVALSARCSQLWGEVLEKAAAKPSPLSFFDAATLMGPAVVGRGTEVANRCYENLIQELNMRIQTGVGAVQPERLRIYWDGMPVWGRLRAHSDLFSSLGASVLASTYCSSWVFSALDPEKPLESMARAYTELFIGRSDPFKENYIREKLDFFKIDGIVFHDAKTCPNNSNCRYGMPKRLQADTGIPTLVINGDLNDLRMVSDEQTRTNIEAFAELLEEGL